MKLFYNLSPNQQIKIAEISPDEKSVKIFFGPLRNEIKRRKGIPLPAITKLKEKFKVSDFFVATSNPKFGKAVKIYLDNEWVSKSPKQYIWSETDTP